MGYKWLNGYATSLNAKLGANEMLLPIDDAKSLSQKLDVDHSYLIINDGTGAEIVKVISFGNQVKIERGKDGTEPKSFPAGSCVKWEVTKIGMTETVCNSDFKCCDLEECGCGN